MTQLSCDAVHRPDLKGIPWRLQEGEYYFSSVDDHGLVYDILWCKVPGLNAPRGLPLNIDKKLLPTQRAVWQWNRNIEKPTLSPSIMCHVNGDRKRVGWHGYLRNGRFESCD